MINQRIIAEFENRIDRRLSYFGSTNLKTETINFVDNWEKTREETIKMLESGEMWAQDGYIQRRDGDCISKIQNLKTKGKEIESVIEKIYENFQTLKTPSFYRKLKSSLMDALNSMQLTNSKQKVQSLIFSYDYEPIYSIHPCLPSNYEILIEEPKYFQNEIISCDYKEALKFDFSVIVDDVWHDGLLNDFVNSTPYENMKYITGLQKLYLDFTFLSLNKLFRDQEIQTILKSKPIVYPFYVYSIEHDCEAQLVFYSEGF